jgi:membrane protease YdiL (CAAX protease family)
MPTWYELLGFALALVLLVVTLVGAYRTAVFLRRFRPRTNPLLSPAENLVRVAFILISFAAAWLLGGTPEDLGLTGFSLADAALGVGLGLGALVVINLVAAGGIAVFGPGIYRPGVIRAILPRQASEWPGVLGALVLASFQEELFFRGLLLGVFDRFLPAAGLNLAVGVLFGLAHLPQGRLGVVLAGLASIYLGFVFLWRNNLLAPWVCHFVFNAGQVALAARFPHWLKFAEAEGGP